MPYPSSFLYATVKGDMYGAAEQWQFGLKMTDGGASSEATALAIADDVERWWRGTGYVAANTFFATNNYRLTELKVARIQADGKYPPDEPSYSHFYLPAIVGANAPNAFLTPQSTICVTLTTALPRGLASKGRIFIPISQGMVPNADGRATANEAAVVARSIAQLVSEINANALVGNVAVFSRGRGVPAWDAVRRKVTYTYPNPGAVNNVTGARVGRVIDTQRRRRRQLVEDYQAAPLP